MIMDSASEMIKIYSTVWCPDANEQNVFGSKWLD